MRAGEGEKRVFATYLFLPRERKEDIRTIYPYSSRFNINKCKFLTFRYKPVRKRARRFEDQVMGAREKAVREKKGREGDYKRVFPFHDFKTRSIVS